MQLEISYPHETLDEKEIEKLKKQLLLFHKHDKEISKAEIILKEVSHLPIKSYLCEVIISIYGNVFSFNREGDSYEKAINDAIRGADEKIDELKMHLNELPEEQVSTVKV